MSFERKYMYAEEVAVEGKALQAEVEAEAGAEEAGATGILALTTPQAFSQKASK